MANPDQHTRDGNGRYTRTLEKAERDAKAARLRALGWSYSMIAAELGYPRAQAAWDGVQTVLKEAIQEPAEDLLNIELGRLDSELVRLHQLETAAKTVLDAEHITVSNGKVILDPRTEQPLADDAPVLAAIDRLVKIEDARRRNAERRAKLLGLDAEQKISMSGGVRYEVVGVNPEDLT